MKSQSKGLAPLPSSKDKHFWTSGAEMHASEIGPNRICKECSFEIDVDKREAECTRCGRGFRFRVDQIEYKKGKLYDRKSGKRLT